jgi:hypothetical protein
VHSIINLDGTKNTVVSMYETDQEIDWPEEISWALISKHGWIPTPQLLFAIKDYLREEHADGLERVKEVQSGE